ncbi:MAG TPA: tetratricopeptide repeat protein [Polyangia bacterium]
MATFCYSLFRVAKHIDRKELKRPDQFVSFWTKVSADASRILASQGRAVAIGAAALAVVIVATVAFTQVRARRAESASQELARIDRIANADLLPADGSAAAAAKDEGVPRFKTDKERLEGALKELDAFIAANPSSGLRAEALLHRGSYLLGLQRYDDAVVAYTQALSGGPAPPLRDLAQEGLGYAYEAKGELDKAADAFSRLGDAAAKDSARADGFYQDRALYHKARIAEIKGNRADAAKLYREVLDKAPGSSLRDEISNRLAVLESK